MAQHPDQERLRQLDERIARAKGAAPAGGKGSGEGYSQGEVAWRMVIELVSGLLIGFAVGYGLDWLFGTTPILMVVFFFFGFAAGIKTMLGTAAEMQKKQEAALAALQGQAVNATSERQAATTAGDERTERGD